MTNIQVTYAAQGSLIDSLVVAEKFDKQHKHVMCTIRSMECHFPGYFVESFYLDAYERKQPKYEMTKEGFLLLSSNYRGEKAMMSKIEILSRYDMIPPSLPERKEIAFLDSLNEALGGLGLFANIEYQIGKYRVDGFIKSENIAIEYDEGFHKYQVAEDLKRQSDISKICGCRFIRVSSEQSHAANIGKVINFIIENKKESM